MAVFLVNTCKFGRCGATFQTLKELIQHIEETHIDFDPNIIEKYELQQPSSLPLSYVLRVSCENSKKVDGLKKFIRAISPALSICSTGNTPTGSEMEDDFYSDSDESCDSWTSKEELNSDYILRMLNPADGKDSKPFACPVPGCKKRYKNISGIKYHTKNGHCKEPKPSKQYKCHCGKSYKTVQGLKTHNINVHHSQGISKPSKSSQDLIPTISNDVSMVQSLSESSKSIFHPKSQPDLVSKASSLGEVIATLTCSIKKDKAKAEDRSTYSAALGTRISPLQLLPNESNLPTTVIEHKPINQTPSVGTKPPPRSPILQQHLLSPVLPKKNAIT